MLTVSWLDELDPDSTEAVRGLLLAARRADGRPEVQADGPLPPEFGGGRHLLGYVGADLAAYAHLDTAGDAFGRQVAELLVDPRHRRRGYGAAMLRTLTEEVPRKLRIWAHGDHPAAARLAERFGLSRVRELLVMSADATIADWPEPRPPAGITLRTFVPGQDEQAVIAVNGRAFDWHPEQGTFSVEQLRQAETEDWFDADGFFVAENTQGRIDGFHWTKVHPADPDGSGDPATGGGAEPVGEVYVVGVDPDAQGGGLGRALTVAGLRYLRDAGLRRVILYVEGDNAPAIAVYRRLGFEPAKTDVQYALEP